VRGDAVSPGARDLGDESVGMKEMDESGDFGAAASGFGGVFGFAESELFGDVGMAEAVEGAFAAHDCGEEGLVVAAEGVEAAAGSGLGRGSFAEAVEAFEGGSGVVDGGEGGEVVFAGAAGMGGVVAEVGDALGHGEPVEDSASLACAPAADLELAGLVDDRFDAVSWLQKCLTGKGDKRAEKIAPPQRWGDPPGGVRDVRRNGKWTRGRSR